MGLFRFVLAESGNTSEPTRRCLTRLWDNYLRVLQRWSGVVDQEPGHHGVQTIGPARRLSSVRTGTSWCVDRDGLTATREGAASRCLDQPAQRRDTGGSACPLGVDRRRTSPVPRRRLEKPARLELIGV